MVLDRVIRWSLGTDVGAPVSGIVGTPGLGVKKNVDGLAVAPWAQKVGKFVDLHPLRGPSQIIDTRQD